MLSGYAPALWQLAWERYRTHLTLSDCGKLYNAGSVVAASNPANTQLLVGSYGFNFVLVCSMAGSNIDMRLISWARSFDWLKPNNVECLLC
jgi:hypothetical protein